MVNKRTILISLMYWELMRLNVEELSRMVIA